MCVHVCGVGVGWGWVGMPTPPIQYTHTHAHTHTHTHILMPTPPSTHTHTDAHPTQHTHTHTHTYTHAPTCRKGRYCLRRCAMCRTGRGDRPSSCLRDHSSCSRVRGAGREDAGGSGGQSCSYPPPPTLKHAPVGTRQLPATLRCWWTARPPGGPCPPSPPPARGR